MMVGLSSSTGSKMVVLGGILSIAVADAFSDALGIHISEESDHSKSEKEIWASTLSTFLAKLLFSLTFLIPVMLFSLEMALKISIIWGLGLLAILSYFIAKSQKNNPISTITEHISIAILVITLTHYIGKWINVNFG